MLPVKVFMRHWNNKMIENCRNFRDTIRRISGIQFRIRTLLGSVVLKSNIVGFMLWSKRNIIIVPLSRALTGVIVLKAYFCANQLSRMKKNGFIGLTCTGIFTILVSAFLISCNNGTEP